MLGLAHEVDAEGGEDDWDNVAVVVHKVDLQNAVRMKEADGGDGKGDALQCQPSCGQEACQSQACWHGER